MTPTAQNIALAAHLGWRKLPDGKIWRLLDTDDYDCEDLPDYGSDLNQMAIAEAKLTAGQHYMFRKHLWEITDQSKDRSFVGVNGEEHNRRYCSAAAPQRRECILKALGLWSDSL